MICRLNKIKLYLKFAWKHFIFKFNRLFMNKPQSQKTKLKTLPSELTTESQ